MPGINLPASLATIAETPRLNYPNTNGPCIFPTITAKNPTIDPFTGFVHWSQQGNNMPTFTTNASTSTYTSNMSSSSSSMTWTTAAPTSSLSPYGTSSLAPGTTIYSNERWHAPSDDESFHMPIRSGYSGGFYTNQAKEEKKAHEKKHPKFTVEIIEEF